MEGSLEMTKRTSSRQAPRPDLGSMLARAAATATLSFAWVLAVGAEPMSVTDFSSVEIQIIEPGDIVEALAVPRGTKVQPDARPRVRLPVYFAVNSIELEPEALQLLAKVGKALRAEVLESFNFSVEAHTDSVGDPGFNVNLSERRAEVVRAFLQERGVSKDRLKSVGRGEEDPIDTNVTIAGRQHNRRVEIINMGSESQTSR
jgi:outer membrane protein OmpA-like peptidoglycan-associated protein